MKAYHAALGRAWAITQDGLQLILDVTSGDQRDIELAKELRTEFEAVQHQSGTKMEGTNGVTVRGRVATMNMRGPITPYATMFSDVSGATSVESLTRDFNLALSNPGIDAIVLRIDSPGGAATDIQEFADAIYAARSQKSVIAYINGLGCSAAYWLASACSEVVISRTAVLGSIGVITAVPKSQQDPKTVQFVSSQSPNKRPDPETKDGASEIQTMLDDTADEFVSAVARFRGVTAEDVLSNFGQGGVMVGKRAVSAGLADRLGSYEGVVKQLNEGAGDMPTKSRAKVAAVAADDVQATVLADAYTEAAATGETAAAVAVELSATMNAFADMADGAVEAVEDLTAAAEDGNATLEAVLEDGIAVAKQTLSADESIAADQAQIQSDQLALQTALATAPQPTAEDLLRAELEQLRGEKAQLEMERELGTLAAYATEQGWFGAASEHATFMHALSEDQRGYFRRMMNAYAAQVNASALFGQIGVSNPGGEFASATSEYLSTVADYEAKNNVNTEQAMVAVNKKHPELRAAYLAEQRSKK